MLVVAEQRPAGVGRQAGLARAGQAEQQRRRPVRALVGRAVQRQDARLREQVVHHGEHQLLDAAAVGRAVDQAEPAVEVHGDDHVRSRPVGEFAQSTLVLRGVDLVVGQHEHLEAAIGKDALFAAGGHRAKHVVREQRVQGSIRDGLHRQAVARIRSEHSVGDEQPGLAREDLQGVVPQHLERLRIERDAVGRVPVDVLLAFRVAHDHGVLGTAARGIGRRPGGQGTTGCRQGLAVLQCVANHLRPFDVHELVRMDAEHFFQARGEGRFLGQRHRGASHRLVHPALCATSRFAGSCHTGSSG